MGGDQPWPHVAVPRSHRCARHDAGHRANRRAVLGTGYHGGMPPLPTIANTYRVTLPWSNNGGIKPINVIHVRKASGTDEQVAEALDAAFNAGHHSWMFNVLQDARELTDLEILPLDGSSATMIEGLTTPETGGAGSGELIPQACALVSLHTSTRGPRGRGRVYVGPLLEGDQADGLLNGSRATTMLNGWGEFIANLASGTPSLELVVASYVHATAATVTSVRIDTVIATQRRRLDQLR